MGEDFFGGFCFSSFVFLFVVGHGSLLLHTFGPRASILNAICNILWLQPLQNFANSRGLNLSVCMLFAAFGDLTPSCCMLFATFWNLNLSACMLFATFLGPHLSFCVVVVVKLPYMLFCIVLVPSVFASLLMLCWRREWGWEELENALPHGQNMF